MADLEGNVPAAHKVYGNSSRFLSNLADFVLYLIIASPVVLLKYVVTPYQRGFFCDDRSIALPYKPDTFSTTSVALIGLLVPTVFILAVEALHHTSNKHDSETEPERTCLRRLRSNSLISKLAQVYAIFLFGGITTLLLTDIVKYSLGVLRPHFLVVCQPDWTKFNCSDGYITKAVCTGDVDMITDARLSFPSRHASFSAFAMGFLVLYIEARVHISWSKFLKLTIQLAAVVFAMFCGYSRIFDNAHHWSDVLAGSALGAVVAVVCGRCVLQKMNRPTMKESEKHENKDSNICSTKMDKSWTNVCDLCTVDLERLPPDVETNSQMNTHF